MMTDLVKNSFVIHALPLVCFIITSDSQTTDGSGKAVIREHFGHVNEAQPLKTGSIYSYIHPVIILDFAPRC